MTHAVGEPTCGVCDRHESGEVMGFTTTIVET
jgi:hypothetical protein